MNILRKLRSLFTPRAPTEPVQRTVIALAPESRPRPFTQNELTAIAGAVREVQSVGRRRVQPCSPAPTYAEAVEEIRQERLAAGKLDTRNADAAIALVQKAARPRKKAAKVAPIERKRKLRSGGCA